MRLNKKGALMLTPEESACFKKLNKDTRDFVVRCVKSALIRTILYDMSVDEDGRVIFTPKTASVESKTE